jgi:metal-responsive CopG/Arc/MetJ family transcriptional regulator
MEDMRRSMNTTMRDRITVSVRADLLAGVDRLRASRPDRPSRSRLVEEALQRWYEDQLRVAIEEATEAYYRSLTDDDRAEDAEWAETAAGAAKAVWEE